MSVYLSLSGSNSNSNSDSNSPRTLQGFQGYGFCLSTHMCEILREMPGLRRFVICPDRGALRMGNAPAPQIDHRRKDPAWFDSFRFQTVRKLIGSVRFGSAIICSGSMRFSLRCSDVSWLDLLRFGSVPRPVPTGCRIN